MIVSLAYGIVIIFQYEMPHSARSSPTSSADSTHVGFGTSSTPSTDTNRKLWLFRRVSLMLRKLRQALVTLNLLGNLRERRA